MDIGDLNRLYEDGESCDSDLFCEQRSNLRLKIGLHYTRKSNRLYRALGRESNLTKNQKIRLTKNHIGRASSNWINSIVAHTPNVAFSPRNKSELKDIKAAELNRSVWEDIKHQKKLKKRMREWAADFYDIGECFVKVYWDPEKGRVLSNEMVLDEFGMPVLDENGEPVNEIIKAGDLEYERVLGFNLLRDPSAKSYDDAEWVCIRKMVATKTLKNRFKDDEKKLGYITETADKTYQVFDGQTGAYCDEKGLTLVREHYFRPDSENPNGRFYISTEAGILFEDELPLGLFPIFQVGFEEVATSPRAFSQIKQLRPVQAEINRISSFIAQTQTSVGMDKLLLMNGASMSPGGELNGIRAVKVNGQEPKYLAGRTADNYITHLQTSVTEFYQLANMRENEIETGNQLDSYAMLFRSLKDKKKFILYADKFSDFIIEIVEASLKIKKAYCSEDELIPVVGKSEYVNIAEFKNIEDICYQIKIEAIAEDTESLMARQMVFNSVLQYAGGQLDQNQLGKLINSMPFSNGEHVLGDLAIDEENATNDILALDRGQWVDPDPDENHQYLIQRLTHRMKSSDFSLLPPEIQRNYHNKRQIHQQIMAEQEQAVMAAKAGYIPSGGALVGVDLYVPHPTDPTKSKRARLPSEAIHWVIERLDQQGSSQERLESVGVGNVQQMVDQGMLPGDGQGLPPQGPPQGYNQ